MKEQRWRLTFAKTEAMRFTGHLDLILTWERTFRRSGLPLSYSEGFSPRPVINLAAPLPLGYTSSGEIGDFWLSQSCSRMTLQSSLTAVLPPGLKLIAIDEIPSIHGNKLPALVEAALYSLDLPADTLDLAKRVDSLLAKEHLIRQRKDKTYDLRPLILSLAVKPSQETDRPVLSTKMPLLQGASGRPDEILSALEIPVHRCLICREQIYLRDISPR